MKNISWLSFGPMILWFMSLPPSQVVAEDQHAGPSAASPQAKIDCVQGLYNPSGKNGWNLLPTAFCDGRAGPAAGPIQFSPGEIIMFDPAVLPLGYSTKTVIKSGPLKGITVSIERTR